MSLALEKTKPKIALGRTLVFTEGMALNSPESEGQPEERGYINGEASYS